MPKKPAVRTLEPTLVLAGGAPMQVFPCATSAAASPDGASLYTGHADGAVRAWDARTGAHRSTWPQPRSKAAVCALAVRPDGALLAAAGGLGVALRSLPDGELRATLTGFRGNALSMAMLPGGDGVVVGSDDGAAYVLALDGAVRRSVAHGDAVLSVAASGRTLATAGLHAPSPIRLWGLDDGAPAGELRGGRSHPPVRLAFAPEGDALYAAYNARPGEAPAVVAWDAGRAAIRWERGGIDNVTDLATLDGGRRLVTAHQDSTILVWDADSGTVVHRLDCRAFEATDGFAPACVAPAPGGGLFACVAYKRVVRLAREGSVLTVDDPPRVAPHRGGVRALAFVGERAVVSLGADGELARWDVGLAEAPVRAAAPEGASGLAGERASALLRTPGGLARVNGRTLRPERVKPGDAFVEPEAAPSLARDGGPTLALPDGARALVATRDGVAVLDRATGALRASLVGLRGVAQALATSPSGKWAAASDGAAIVAWKLPR